MRTLVLTLAAVALAVAMDTRAAAQLRPGPSGPTPGPVVSPYLNLRNNRTDPAISYFGIVRPQMAFRSAISGLQQEINQQAAADLTEIQPSRATGHAVYFNN